MANDVKTTIETNASDIATNAANIATKADQTALNTANDKITALEGKTNKFNDDGTTLTGMEEVGANKVSARTLKVGDKEITADTVAGYDAAVKNTANITYDETTQTTYINKGTAQQVVIDEKGLKVGKNTSRMNDITGFATSKNLYVGTTDAENPTAADSKFYVDGETGETVVNGTAGTTTITGGGVTISKAASSEYVSISEGSILATDSIKATKIISAGLETRMADGKVVAKNGLYVGYSSTDITGATYDNSKFAVDGATGNTAVGGTLSVAGETTFANGIKTDTIVEKTANAGVTVNGNKITTDKKFNDVELKNGNVNATDITANGVLKGKTLGIGTNGSEFTVDENGNTTVGGTLDVTGKTTLKNTLDVKGATTLQDELQVDKKATFGNGTGLQTVIEGGNITAGGMLNSQSAKIGYVGIDNTGAITGVTSLTTDALTVTGAFTTGNLTVNGDLTASGAINGKTISINNGGSIAGVNFENGGTLTATTGTIGDVSFATGGNVSGINNLKATGTIQGETLKVDDNNYLDNEGLHAKKAVIDKVVIEGESIKTIGANGLNVENVNLNNGAITAKSATIGYVNKLDNTGITVNAEKAITLGTSVITNGQVKVSDKTSLANEALVLNDTNKWTQAGGLVADKATVNGVVLGDARGKATFTDDENKVTTIFGDKITTGTITASKLLVDSISLGKDSDNENITIDSNGDVTTEGDIKITDAAGNVMTKLAKDSATFGKDAANQTVIDKGKISAKAEDNNHQQAGLKFDENGLTVNGRNAEGKTSSFSFNAKTGDNTFTDKDGMTTTINGSSVRSFNSATGAGHLNGATLNLWKDSDNATYMTAGGATFIGKKGDSSLQGNKTTIDGGVITTDTLNVERINLGGELYDKNGTAFGGNLSMDKDGNFSAAGGNFTVKGGTATDPDRGTMHNKVGNTYFDTTKDGASMKFDNTATTGGIKSEVAVADDSAKISAGASSIEVKNDGITNNGVTTFNGTTGTTTKIDGGTITTNHLITDKLTITGSGNADGTGSTTGSIAFGGNGSITSNIKDGTKETTFKTDETGTFTEAKDGANVTTNTVNAKGNTNEVTDGTNTSTVTQTATSIGGVVTNGTVTMRQELTADGVKVSVDGDTANYTQITNKDVSITDQKNPGKRINLSDLGQLNDLDGELTARDEYTNNKTAVGAINAEAAIRREEVARLDGRINDVNDRVNKVGAMAAAIASLKSIGYDPQAPSEFSIGLGQYKGETGVAMGFFHYPNKNFMINVSLSTAGGETMGGIGATWRFGHKSPQKLLEEQREAQAKKELAAAEKYQAAAKLAKEAQERAEYAAKLARQAQVSADNAKAAADATQAKHFG